MASGDVDTMADIKAAFFIECEELLEEMTDGLETLRSTEANPEALNSVFRAVHSIKGGAAAFALGDLTDFAHDLETRLATYRDAGELPAATEIDQFETGADRLATLVGLAAGAKDSSEEESLDDHAAAGTSTSGTNFRDFLLTLRPSTANVPKALKQLNELGVVNTELVPGALPDLQAYSPTDCSLVWQSVLSTELDDDRVKDELNRIDPEIEIEPMEKQTAQGSQPTGVDEISNKAKATSSKSAAPTIRVALDRIDRLINLVGELVVNQAMLSRSAEDLGAEANSNHMIGLEELMRLTRDIQDSVMQIRAQPVKPLFQRMARICREAAAMSGKPVELVTDGHETEIDKTVIERLADPLTHMIRNAVDHGIEAADDRHHAGKSDVGRITLRASHRSGQVILELSDDGAGIDREKVLSKARAKGLVSPTAQLSSREIDSLLFQPGFSTAEEVSSLSGRGVGMDVVRASIQSLGGRISIDSTPNEGTRFEIALPLTLAVLDAMIVRVSGETLVLPLTAIHETVKVQQRNLLELNRGQKMLRYGGKAIALFDLGEELGFNARREDLGECVAIITSADGQVPTALLVDEIFEQRQVVIKGIQKGFSNAACVAAATIMGDGRIALIIDPFDPSLCPGGASSAQSAAVPLDLSA